MQTITIEEIRRIAAEGDREAIRDIAGGRRIVTLDTATSHGFAIRSETRFWVDYASDLDNPHRSGAPSFRTHREALAWVTWKLLREEQFGPVVILNNVCQHCLKEPCMCSPVQRLSLEGETTGNGHLWDPLRRDAEPQLPGCPIQ